MTSYRADKPNVDGRTDGQTDRQTDGRTDGGNDITPSAEVPRGKNHDLITRINSRMDERINPKPFSMCRIAEATYWARKYKG